MRFWIVLMTICSLLSLPFSGSMAADTVHHSNDHSNEMHAMSEHDQHESASATEDGEHCPQSMPVTEVADDCCDDNANGPECGSCPPDCGHCAMSDHGSCAALTMQQTFAQSVINSAVVSTSSFYQLLSGQPTPPPIIS
ncbi:hypothetical protein [Aliidiomarina soli]|uniref:Uncharacterized protein n=1 Tax=Aliidiomarina soli TaxID=1928574 RepID=A0A432WE12_9GAMM|nr:hypothetical protein [Aliidiomarina soli]RUO31095.1 hypothetical protein CWE14_11390 [Aliidiomarina soli]